MSFIGSLDQFDLSILLLKIEEYHKTGLLVVKKDERSVELAFRQGSLMCIGPVKPNVTLGERLAQARVIAPEASRAVEFTIGDDRYRENESALAFFNFGYVNKESLYRWAEIEARLVLEVMLNWQSGEIYFEDDAQPPANRLLIALSVSTLLSAIVIEPSAHPLHAEPLPAILMESQAGPTSQASYSAIPTRSAMHGEHPSSTSTTQGATGQHYISAQSLLAGITMPGGQAQERHTDALPPLASTQQGQQDVSSRVSAMPTVLPTPMPVDISSLQPNMVLVPANLSSYRESNPSIQLTPDQWRLFAHADGQTTLAMIAQEYRMSPEQVCQAAGELKAWGLVIVSFPETLASREAGQTTTTAPRRPGYPIETQSQWGNGGNGATFVLGNGWVVSQRSAQPAY